MTDQLRATLFAVPVALASAWSCSGLAEAHAAEDRSVCTEATGTLAALCRLPPHRLDIEEPTAVRENRLTRIAQAIDLATWDKAQRARLIALGWHETRYAAYIDEGRCSDGPVGERCDNGKSHGPWQLRHNAIQRVPDDTAGQAAMAASLLRFHQRHCSGSVAKAFHSYGTGGKCVESDWAKRRARHAAAIEGRLWQ